MNPGGLELPATKVDRFRFRHTTCNDPCGAVPSHPYSQLSLHMAQQNFSGQGT